VPQDTLTRNVLLPELELENISRIKLHLKLGVRKKPMPEVCPRCATLSTTGYDRRRIRLKDAPLRNRAVTLWLTKRRLFCKPCKKPFTEPVPGVRKGRRTTERYRAALLWACENYTDLKRVKNQFRCSSGFLYQAFYEQLELKRRKHQYPWPETIGIDEHSFRRNRRFGHTEFASILVDYNNKKVFELVQGKTSAELSAALINIPGRENVKNVILDLCDPFKNFAREHFPNSQIIADKFHVLRLLTPALNRRRKLIAGDRRKYLIGRLLLRNGYKLDYFRQRAIAEWLQPHPELKEIYETKERLHRFYRTRGHQKAADALTTLTDQMARSQVPEIKTLRKTLMKWRREILAYFFTGLTNGRTEGYNNLAKLIQKRAFGYKSFENYRLRLLSACA
jgi:transposase